MSGLSAQRTRTRPDRPATVREPLRMPRIDGLDGLRILSALGVLAYHVLGAFVGGNPKAGVILPPVAFVFFLISGYVIYRPLAIAEIDGRPPPALRAYYTSRLLRVMPLWLLVLGVYLITFGTEPLQSTKDWILTLTLLQIVDVDIRYAIIGPAWALSTEWVFYLVAPLWSRGVNHLRIMLAPAADRATWQFIGLVPVTLFCLYVPAARPFLGTVIGVALAIVHVSHTRSGRFGGLTAVLRSTDLSAAVTLIGWIVLLAYPYRKGLSVQWASDDPSLLLIWTLVATAWFSPVVFGRGAGPITSRLGRPHMVAMAQLTFGIYLWHDLVIRVVQQQLGSDTHLLAAFHLTIVGTFLAAIVTFVGLEEPLIRARHRWGNSKAPLPPTLLSGSRTDPPRPIRAIDGLLPLSVIGLLAAQVVRTTATTPANHRVADLVTALAIGLLFGSTAHIEYRALMAARVRGTPPRPIRYIGHRLGLIYPIYWVGQAATLLQTGTEGIDGAGDWLQIVALAPFPDPSVLLDHGLGPVAWAASMLVVFAFYVPLHAHVAALLGRRHGRWFTEIMMAVILGTAILQQVVAGSSTAGLLLGFPIGISIAALDVEQRVRRRRFVLLRRPNPAAAIAFTTAAITLFAAWPHNRSGGPASPGIDGLDDHVLSATIVSSLLIFAVSTATSRTAVARFLRSHPIRTLTLADHGMLFSTLPLIIAIHDRSELSSSALFAVVLVLSVVIGLATRRLITDPVRLTIWGSIPPLTGIGQ